MQLYLVHNDPLNTLFVTQDGEPLYSAHTVACDRLPADLYPASPHPSFSRPSPDSSASSSSGSSNLSAFSGTSFTSGSSFQTSPPRSSPSGSIKPPSSIPIPPYRFIPQSVSAPTSSPSSPLPKHDQPSFYTSSPNPRIPITRTHSSPHPQVTLSHHPADSALPAAFVGTGPLTSVKRLESHRVSRGNVETEIGIIEDYSEDVGTRVQLCHIGMVIEIGAASTAAKRTPSSSGSSTTARVASSSHALSCRTEVRSDDGTTALQAFRDFCENSQRRREAAPVNQGGEVEIKEELFVPDPTWDFTGPDGKPYKWLCLARCPVLVHNSQPAPTPIARYRAAKLGIVSRSRRGLLEILPAGLELEDMIVITFVAYSRMRLNGKIGHTMSVYPPPLSSVPSSERVSPEPLVHQQSSKQKNVYLNGIVGHHHS